MLVNLGIGIPSLVANHVAEGVSVFFQSEKGLIGTGTRTWLTGRSPTRPDTQRALSRSQVSLTAPYPSACGHLEQRLV